MAETGFIRTVIIYRFGHFSDLGLEMALCHCHVGKRTFFRVNECSNPQPLRERQGSIMPSTSCLVGMSVVVHVDTMLPRTKEQRSVGLQLTRHIPPIVGPILGQRRRRWTNIGPPLG